MSASPIPTPTVGRIVLVPVTPLRNTSEWLDPSNIEIRPAIVVRVLDRADGLMPLINVRVFSDGVNDNLATDWMTSLKYDQDDHRVGTWHWMPYQIQTAGTIHKDVPTNTVPVPQSSIRVTKELIDSILDASTWTDTKIGRKTTVVL